MTEDQERLLAVFEVRVRDLIALCEERKMKISELEVALEQAKAENQELNNQIEELKTKCDNMLTAQVVSVNEVDMKSARMRLSKLVREVDKCIALLNE